MVLSLQLPLLFREGVTWCSDVQNSARYSSLPQQPESCPARPHPCLEDAYQAWVYSENDFYGCSLSGHVTSRWPFCRTGGPLSWFFFFREGKSISKPGFWILCQAFYNMKELLLADLLGVLYESPLILHCGAVASLLNLCLLLLLHDLPDLRQVYLQENALWVSNTDVFSPSAS